MYLENMRFEINSPKHEIALYFKYNTPSCPTVSRNAPGEQRSMACGVNTGLVSAATRMISEPFCIDFVENSRSFRVVRFEFVTGGPCVNCIIAGNLDV